MLFHKFLRALLEAWGHKPKGTTVWELLKEVWQNLPFGVKTEMVEIVPEQRFKGRDEQLDETEYYVIPSQDYEIGYHTLIPGIKYIIVINGVKYEGVCYSESEKNYVDITANVDMPAVDNIILWVEERIEQRELNIGWHYSLGETITLAIYEEQEIVIPLDPKFVGGNMVLKVVSDGEGNYIWEQNYTFDDIYEHAINGQLVMHKCYVNSIDNTTGNYDEFNVYLPNTVRPKNHTSGARVRFICDDGSAYTWTEDGYEFSFED